MSELGELAGVEGGAALRVVTAAVVELRRGGVGVAGGLLDILQGRPVLEPEDSLDRISLRLGAAKETRCPVVESFTHPRLVGFLAPSDLLRARVLASHDEHEDGFEPLAEAWRSRTSAPRPVSMCSYGIVVSYSRAEHGDNIWCRLLAWRSGNSSQNSGGCPSARRRLLSANVQLY